MNDHAYKRIEVVGTSTASSDDAIATAFAKARETLHHLNWYEVTQIRGNIANDKIEHYQVTLKVGFRLD